MNLYFISFKTEIDWVVLASSKEKAEEIFTQKTKCIPDKNKTKRVPQGHYLVGYTFLFDDIS